MQEVLDKLTLVCTPNLALRKSCAWLSDEDWCVKSGKCNFWLVITKYYISNFSILGFLTWGRSVREQTGRGGSQQGGSFDPRQEQTDPLCLCSNRLLLTGSSKGEDPRPQIQQLGAGVVLRLCKP